MRRVLLRATARRDITDHYVYLAENAGSAAAEKFLANADLSFQDLAAWPDMATPLQSRLPELAGMRKWRVKGFENFLIFYQTRTDAVSIVRVLHASQDWWRLLDIEN
ncbi:MAG TPA: type II toxin-antitoxin system RelE/ParE family toxin [Alphaproteobacteria bacterium]|jgi:toxin ParE1/3/4|nr:type II toxin-antitoxin system RelE/ParE family toxin [Alphaproteobacteria bacterium]